MTAKLLSPKSPLPFGEFLCAAGLVQRMQVESALAKQSKTGERLGEALVHQTRLDPKDMAAALMVQQQLRESLKKEAGVTRRALPECLRLGELLVARGDVPRKVLDEALAQQKPGRQLGDVLLQMGAINTAALEAVLPLQKRLLSAVLCAGLGFAFAFATPSAQAAGGASARLTISATIAKTIKVSAASHPASFTIKPSDLTRGYVDIDQPSQFNIKTNSAEGAALEFHGMDSGADIQSIQITGGTASFTMPASGGVMLLQGGWHPTLERPLRLAYRLLLGPNAQAGTYSWPLFMNVSAL